jgi:hypothetical protein
MAFAALLALALAAPPDALLTTAERSGFARTGRYEEAVHLCRALAKARPASARCLEFGRTPEGRPLVALVASAEGRLTPARARGRPVVLFQGGIHAGEMDGKDAGLIALRELLERGSKGPLGKVVAILVPVLNADGHERFGPNQRPNQAGPEETGWRTTARNLNLNRDYAKAEAPETQAVLRLLGEWDPVVYADLHVTDGTVLQHDVAVLVEPTLEGPEPLRAEARKLQAALLERLAGHRPLGFYPDFILPGDPASGLAAAVAPPRFATGYRAVRYRIGVHLEAHSWKDYRTRVEACQDFVRALLELAAAEGQRWMAAAREADGAGARLAGRDVPLAYKAGARQETAEVLGYAWRREPSPVTGRPVTIYERAAPETWRIPFFPEVEPSLVVKVPKAGYLVPAAHAAWVADKLRVHGIAFRELGEARGREVLAFRVAEVKIAPAPLEGRQTVEARGEWRPERRGWERGSLFVPVAQPRARLAVHLLEPRGPDSLLSWGFFNAHLERKEHVEEYVLEPYARMLLAEEPGLRAEFQRRLAAPAFASDAEARLEFFARRHPSWDERLGLYPVYRLEEPPDPERGRGPQTTHSGASTTP